MCEMCRFENLGITGEVTQTFSFRGPQDINRVRLWFPEEINCTDGRLDFRGGKEWPDHCWPEGKNWEERKVTSRGSDVNFDGRLFLNELGFGMEMKVTNNRETTLERVKPVVCMQLASSPDFTDPEMNRTYVRVDGKIRPLREMRLMVNDYRTQKHYHLKAGEPLPTNESIKFDGVNHWGVNPILIDSPLVATQSKVGDWIIGIKFEPAFCVSNNAKAFITCLHSIPCLPEIKPGESQTAIGQIYLLRGTIEELFEKYG